MGQAAGEKTDKLGQTAVHKAAANGHARCVKALIGFYSKEVLGRLDKAGRTPLMLAAANGHADVFALYKGDANLVSYLAVKSPDGKTVFDLARENDRAAVLTALAPLRVLVDAASGDTAAVEQAYKADPAKFPAGEVVQIAARKENLPVLKLVLGWYADKPPAEKTALLSYTGSNTFPALYSAAMSDWAEGVWELVNPKWWKDGPALKAFVDAKFPNCVHVLDEYYQKNYPAAVATIRKALAEAEKVK